MADAESSSESSGVLDQSEIDKLLAEAAGQSAPAPLLVQTEGGRTSVRTTPAKVERYDFRNPVYLSDGELRRLRLVHEDFIRYLGARLSLYLRGECAIKLGDLRTVAYAKFTESLPTPAHLCLFKAEPLAGVGILGLRTRLALTIAERLLGGRGHSVNVDRDLTEIEIGLLEDVILIVLEEWCSQWKNEQDLHPVILGSETNGRFLQTSPKDAVVLVLSLEMQFGDCAEEMQIGVPYYTIEPVVKKMQARRQKEAAFAAAETQRAAWSGAFDHISVPIRAEWEGFDVSLREISCLRAGDVIELPESLLQRARILLNGSPKFIGTVGLDSERIAVQITGKLPTA
jgi:flagellar motor switch protein FliM